MNKNKIYPIFSFNKQDILSYAKSIKEKSKRLKYYEFILTSAQDELDIMSHSQINGFDIGDYYVDNIKNIIETMKEGIRLINNG